MKKRRVFQGLFALVAVGAIIGGVLFYSGRKKVMERQTSKKEYTRLIVAIPLMGVSKKDIKILESEINKITQKEIGVTVEIPELSSSYNYYDEVTMRLSTSQQLDITLGGYGSFMEYYVEGKLEPLDQLLETYGQDIIEQVGEENIQSCNIHNACYGIPINGIHTMQDNCYVLRKDILKKYAIDSKEILTMDDLERVFEVVKKQEPQMIPLVSGMRNGSILANMGYLDTSCGVPVTMFHSKGNNKKLKNIFESKRYKNDLKRVRRWFLKGYINEDVYGGSGNWRKKVSQGDAFAYTAKNYDWEKNSEEIDIDGVKMVKICLNKNILNVNGYESKPYVITKNTVSPEASMKLLNLLYSNAEIENLLCYGVEGIHYVKTADGHITYAPGKAENPFLSTMNNMPNQYITYVWEGKDEDYWKTVKERNESTTKSGKSGFNFDFSNVDTEYRKVVNIYNNYKYILENGMINPEEGRQKMVEEMKKAGLDLILKEEQKQYDIWSNKNRGEEQ